MDGAKRSLSGPLILTAVSARQGWRSTGKVAGSGIPGRLLSRAQREGSRRSGRRRPTKRRLKVGKVTGALAGVAGAVWVLRAKRRQQAGVGGSTAAQGASSRHGAPSEGLSPSTDRKPRYHVSAKEDGGWEAVREGAQRATISGHLKKEVVKQARELARTKEGELVIHKADGSVQDEISYA